MTRRDQPPARAGRHAVWRPQAPPRRAGRTPGPSALLAAGLLALGLAAPVAAQPAPPAAPPPRPAAAPAAPAGAPPGAPPGMEAVDPLNCWWRTSVSAITIGQPFTLVLTCAVIEAETTSAVVDRARLDPRAIELAPFEVLDGSVAPDVVQGDRTFFQIQYRLRFINDAFFNQDVPLPPLTVSYRIQTRGTGQAAGTQGMERRFAMPRLALRVTSLVPGDAADIRDASSMTFADLDAVASRARLLRTGGLVGLGIAAALALLGLVRAVGTRIHRPAAAARLLADATVLRAAARALAAVGRRRDGAAGWSAEDVEQALAASRIVGECAIEREPSQRLAEPGEAVPEGAIGVRTRLGRGPLVVVSAAATAKTLGAALAGRAGASDRLTTLQQALAAFTAAQYADAAPTDDAGLDNALAGVRAVARRLAFERTWLMQRLTLRAWRQPVERPVP